MSNNTNPENCAITKAFCNEVREQCSRRVIERYEMMKEYFTSRVEGISEQLEATLSDLQSALSRGSGRFTELEQRINNTRSDLERDLRSEHQALEEKLEKVQQIPWPLIGVVITIGIPIVTGLLVLWRQSSLNTHDIEKLLSAQEKRDKKIEKYQEEIVTLREALKGIKGGLYQHDP